MTDLPAIAAEIVEAIDAAGGIRPGTRALHAKGTLVAAEFTATEAAPALSRAAFLAGDPVPAVVRFSNASGRPEADHARDGRGMAVKLTLGDGSTTDLVAVASPSFIARTPEDFLELMRARRPVAETGRPDMAVVGAYLERHPEALPAIAASLGAEPPDSYATLTYNGLHAFRWLAADGTARWVRFTWEPEGGEPRIPDEEAAARGADYLQEDIRRRAGEGATGFELVAVLGEEGDPTDDPTAAWPPERERVTVGRLTLTGTDTGRETGSDVLVFDPTRVTDGIELSGDPILRLRPHAYAESVLRRSGVARA